MISGKQFLINKNYAVETGGFNIVKDTNND